MSAYEVLITAVSDRADLFAVSLESLLANVDAPPKGIIVHEDERSAGSSTGQIAATLRETAARLGCSFAHVVSYPAVGMGLGVRWCLRQASTPIVLYTQEDYRILRPLPLRQTLSIMEDHALQHVRFNQRRTWAEKRGWKKVEVTLGGQTFCISDHWYTQTSLWRVERARTATEAVAESNSPAHRFASAWNDWMNRTYGDGARRWDDQGMRHERMRTYIWGPVGEPAFIEHIGSLRGTGPIVDHVRRR